MENISVTYLWLGAGIFLVLVDVLGLSGIGLMFAGFGAIATGIILDLGWVAPDAHLSQFVICFLATPIMTFLLWKPIQKMRFGKQGGYSNIVGETAYVGSSGLSRQSGGEVTWSGTIMKAQLAKNAAVETLDAGAQVTVTEVTGATLIVKPKV